MALSGDNTLKRMASESYDSKNSRYCPREQLCFKGKNVAQMFRDSLDFAKQTGLFLVPVTN
jgi:hypothetical protein